MRKVTAIRPCSDVSRDESMAVTGRLLLAHDARHLRRKAVELTDGTRIFFDLPQAVVLKSGDALILEDGAMVLIEAVDEPLYAITASGPNGLAELAWHIGNRHLAAEISLSRILILRDAVIKTMLEGLGA
nr:urease accessory protein UreE [[Ochrobactrum] quorumnocens]